MHNVNTASRWGQGRLKINKGENLIFTVKLETVRDKRHLTGPGGESLCLAPGAANLLEHRE
jgi:hypothetical protein